MTTPARQNRARRGPRVIGRSDERGGVFSEIPNPEPPKGRIVLVVLENRNAESVAGLELVVVDRDPSLTLRDFRKNRSPDHPGSPARPVLACWGGHPITAITRFS